MESVRRFVIDDDEYIVKEIPYNNNAFVMVAEMDKIRFAYAKEFDDLLYVDTDCFLADLPNETQLKTDEIIMGETITNTGRMKDVFLFYVNGRKDFFQTNYEKLLQRPSDYIFSLSPNQAQLFNGNSIVYEPLSYCHFPLPGIEYSVNQQFNILAEHIKAQEKEINAFRSAVQNINTIANTFDELRNKDKKGK